VKGDGDFILQTRRFPNALEITAGNWEHNQWREVSYRYFPNFYYPVFSPKHKDLNKHNCHFNGGSPVVAWGTVNWSYPARDTDLCRAGLRGP
jgi:hypothetical protein